MKNRKQNRLSGYDYSRAGYYFITICTQDRENHLGNISGGEMILSEYGTIAVIYWNEIPKHYKNIKLDVWVIMPNHIHGIIVISASSVGTAHCAVPTNTKLVSLSQIVKSLKDVTIKQIRSKFGDVRFSWQRSFYDHAIRDEQSLHRIREYIKHNPARWDLDVENTRNFNNNTRAYYNNIFN